MWLIDTLTLKLLFFADPKAHHYAILSHTWGDEEVTFQEMNAAKGPNKKKKGWRKIAETCRLARGEHHLRYAWVDTCCIDKSSSAELSEAINSMFNWYRWSDVCFVFLDDVTFSRAPVLPGLMRGNTVFEDRLRTARWFSRGWTLQELVASCRIVFYDAAGTKLGDKASLADDLVSITNIDRAVLKDVTRLSMVPVARKMSWAASRQTTRVEDMAYCLLGMFDVNMPLLYGEGTRAFLRLQEEIARSGSDWSLLAWSPPHSPPTWRRFRICGVFAPSPAEFWNGHNLRIPGWALEQNFELSLADRGFLRISRNMYTHGDGCARLVLDCLVRDNQAESGMSWLEVDLKRIGAFYARTELGPSSLVKTSSRRRGDSGPGSRWLREPVSVATAIPRDLAEAYQTRPQPFRLHYTESLWRHVGAAQGIVYSDPLTIPPPPIRTKPIPFTAPKGKSDGFRGVHKFLNDSERSLGSTFYPVKEGVFSTSGIRGSRHHHLFEFNAVPVALVWCQELSMTDREASLLWAVLLCPGHGRASSGGDLHPDVFRSLASGGSMSEEERSKILHDHVFQWYSNDDGGYRTDRIPTSLRLVGEVDGAPVVHVIKVHAVLGLSTIVDMDDQSERFVSVLLSHRQLSSFWEDWESDEETGR